MNMSEPQQANIKKMYTRFDVMFFSGDSNVCSSLAGQERFTSMTRVYYKDAHACLVMFDLTQKSTFQNSIKWKKDLDQKCNLIDGSPVPCLLLANKV